MANGNYQEYINELKEQFDFEIAPKTGLTVKPLMSLMNKLQESHYEAIYQNFHTVIDFAHDIANEYKKSLKFSGNSLEINTESYSAIREFIFEFSGMNRLEKEDPDSHKKILDFYENMEFDYSDYKKFEFFIYAIDLISDIKK